MALFNVLYDTPTWDTQGTKFHEKSLNIQIQTFTSAGFALYYDLQLTWHWSWLKSFKTMPRLYLSQESLKRVKHLLETQSHWFSVNAVGLRTQISLNRPSIDTLLLRDNVAMWNPPQSVDKNAKYRCAAVFKLSAIFCQFVSIKQTIRSFEEEDKNSGSSLYCVCNWHQQRVCNIRVIFRGVKLWLS